MTSAAADRITSGHRVLEEEAAAAHQWITSPASEHPSPKPSQGRRVAVTGHSFRPTVSGRLVHTDLRHPGTAQEIGPLASPLIP